MFSMETFGKNVFRLNKFHRNSVAKIFPGKLCGRNVFGCRKKKKNPQKLCGQNISRKSLWPKCFWLPDKNVFHGNVVARQKCFQGKFVAKMFLVARQNVFQGKLVARESQWGVERDSASRQASINYCCLDLGLEISADSKHQILFFGFGFINISQYCTAGKHQILLFGLSFRNISKYCTAGKPYQRFICFFFPASR